MMQATIRPRLTFEEYIDTCFQTEERYELVRGELIKMIPPSWMHIRIALFLVIAFNAEIKRSQHAWEAFIEPGQKTDKDSSRLLDVMVAPLKEIEPVLHQTAILTVPALLVVEIVSPSSASEDYDEKLQEYQTLGIPEYWVVDYEGLGAAKYIGFPKAPTVTVYQLIQGRYHGQRFQGTNQIKSPTFPELQMTAQDVFTAGRG